MKKKTTTNRVFITGTTSGIGFLLAQYFLNKNWEVYGCSRGFNKYIHNKNYKHFRVDLSQIDSILKMINFLEKKHIYFSMLINNAAISSLNYSFLMSDQKTYEIINANLTGPIILTKHFIRMLYLNKGGGCIINITSPAGDVFIKGLSVYGSTKCAINYFTKMLAKELKPLGIKVYGFSPGIFQSRMTRNIRIKEKSIINTLKLKQISNKKDLTQAFDKILNNNKLRSGKIIFLGKN